MKTALKAVVVLCVIAGGGVGMYFWFEQYQIPTVRNMVEEPIYTVAGPDYAVAISEGKQAVSFGPLPGSAFYAGSLAFKQPEEALAWLKSSGKINEGWKVYLLSGDFQLDTHLVRGLAHTNKTLAISHEVPMQ
ncbi:MAG: hypothetical protein U0796_05020 [Gemmatales bacterium]